MAVMTLACRDKVRQPSKAEKIAMDALAGAIIDRLVEHVEGYTTAELNDHFAGMTTALGLTELMVINVVLDMLVDKGELIVLRRSPERPEQSRWETDVIRVSPQTWIEAVG